MSLSGYTTVPETTKKTLKNPIYFNLLLRKLFSIHYHTFNTTIFNFSIHYLFIYMVNQSPLSIILKRDNLLLSS